MHQTDALDLPRKLLDWYRNMGVDCAVDAEATDWLSRGDVKPGAGYTPLHQVQIAPAARPLAPVTERPGPERIAERLPQSVPAPRAFVATSPDAAVMAARTAAQSAASIEDLGRLLAAFDGCGLKTTAKSLCFYRGAAKARLMIIGEAPGREEDLSGSPFVGPAGQLLDKMLAAIGLGDSDVHITNAVYWRPPGNRTPTPQEIEVCRPFLERQMTLVGPELVLLLGAAAARPVLEPNEGIMRARGKWREFAVGEVRVKAMPTLHPAYLLRTPGAKQQVWRDLLSLKDALAR